MPEIAGFATTELIPLYANTELVLPSFLLNYLRTKKFVKFANTNSGGAKMPRVMMDKFWQHEIKLPSKSSQIKFEMIFKKIMYQKIKLKSHLMRQSKLIETLQNQAFTTGFNA